MKTTELINIALKNKKFSVNILGLFRNDDSISYTASTKDNYLHITPYSKSVLQYGIFKGLANDSINTLRSEFNFGYKDKYISDKVLKDKYTQLIESKPFISIRSSTILSFEIHSGTNEHGSNYEEVHSIDIVSTEGVKLHFNNIQSTNLDKSEESIEKFNV